jgi:hypothetical protein
MNWNVFGRKRWWCNRVTILCQEEMKTTKSPSHDSRCPGRDTNRVPPNTSLQLGRMTELESRKKRQWSVCYISNLFPKEAEDLVRYGAVIRYDLNVCDDGTLVQIVRFWTLSIVLSLSRIVVLFSFQNTTFRTPNSVSVFRSDVLSWVQSTEHCG